MKIFYLNFNKGGGAGAGAIMSAHEKKEERRYNAQDTCLNSAFTL